jgi:aerobic carbon-monoxide dehydrogenase large subunit
MTDIAQRYVGSPIKRSEDPRILTGRGHYVDDIRLPEMAHVTFLRSQFPHAAVVAIDVSAAREAPGVIAVFTGAEIETSVHPGPVGVSALLGASAVEYPMLAVEKVRFQGDPVALVVAESRYLAEDALELIQVEYDELAPVASTAHALDPARIPIFEELGNNVLRDSPPRVHGDVNAAFAQADLVVRASLHQHRQQNVPMETRGCIVNYDAGTEELLVWTSSQGPHMVRSGLAKKLDLPAEKIRVRTEDVGGSFGLKIGLSREEVACAVAAL